MNRLKKIKRFFIIFLSAFIFLFYGSLHADELPVTDQQEKPLLSWLPLLSTSLGRFQPDKECPQNQINDIQLLKEQTKITATVALISWDLDCQPPDAAPQSTDNSVTAKLKKTQIDEQLLQILAILGQLPDSEIEIKSVKLSSLHLNKDFPFTVQISKKQQNLLIRLSNEAMQLTVNVDLLTKDLRLASELQSEKLAQYLLLPTAYQGVKKGLLTVNYSANLARWEAGKFVFNSDGGVSGLAENIVMNMNGDINLLSGQINLQKMEGDLSKVNYAIAPDKVWSTPSVKLTLIQPARINFSEQINITTLPLQIRIGAGKFVSKVERGTRQGARLVSHKFPALLTRVKTQGQINNLDFSWSLSLANTTISGDLNYTPEVISGEVKKGQLFMPELIKALQGYLPAVEYWSLSKGVVNYQITFKYNPVTKTGDIKSTLDGVELAGKKEDIVFDGLLFNSVTNFKINNSSISIAQGKQQLKLTNLFVGVPVKATQIDAHSDAGIVVIDNFKTQLLGGGISFANLKIQPGSGTKINLSGLRLSEIIKYSAYPAVVSQGLLDGVLPLTLTAAGASIEQGSVFARAPGGYIKVPQDETVKKMTSKNPALSFTLRLLSDFQFDTLRAMIGYTADGEVDIKAEIQGVSPDVSGKQPVKFNYTHSENLLKLLESLRFSDQVTRQLQERY
ncbi:YdbH domain-containing protein [Psychromonas sp.]|uniref:intermembrane phospholipid transport protein YdbH family protein n=1 Tax=Psychromonas sp. TaxID=1884585 RepID=UPI0035654DCD